MLLHLVISHRFF